MPGLSFSNQNQGRRPGGWIIPVVLILISVVLVTVSARVGNSGPLASVRGVVHSIQAPLQQVTSGISAPFKSIGANAGTASMSEDDIAALQSENQQLRVLVSQLEEYRQQDRRLSSLLTLSDAYGLQTISAKAISTKSGWEQTAVIDAGSASGVQVGMGVMSSCGLYGQVESVTENNATVRLVTDASSSVSAMIQGTRATGIVTGSYDGTLTMSYVPTETTVGEGDVVITSGEGGSYARGIIIGTVSNVEKDSSKLYYNLTLEPVCSLASCEEVLVLTGNEDQTNSLLDKTLLQQVINGTYNEDSNSEESNTSSDGSASSSTSAASGEDDASSEEESTKSSDEEDESGEGSGSSSSSKSSKTSSTSSAKVKNGDEDTTDGDE